jgi:uncharacterized Fe-S center protein
MVEAAVYYMDDRSINIQTSLAAKAQQLFDHAQLHDCFKEGNRVGVKVHMGEWFCTGYLRPILVRAIVDKLKKVGAEPFVTDCTVMPYTPTPRGQPLRTTLSVRLRMDSQGRPWAVQS